MKKIVITALTALTLMACQKEEITPDNTATTVSDNTSVTINGTWHLKEKIVNGTGYLNNPALDKDWNFKGDTMEILAGLGSNNPTFLLDNKNKFPLNETINFNRIDSVSDLVFSRRVIKLDRNEMRLEYLEGTDIGVEVWIR